MTREHGMLLGVFVAALAMQLGTIDDWQHVLTPPFVAGTLLQIAALIRGFFAPSPPVAPKE